MKNLIKSTACAALLVVAAIGISTSVMAGGGGHGYGGHGYGGHGYGGHGYSGHGYGGHGYGGHGYGGHGYGYSGHHGIGIVTYTVDDVFFGIHL